MLKTLKKYNSNYFHKIKYLDYLRYPLEENAVLLESSHGKSINGNIFYLMKELNSNKQYKDYIIYVVGLKNNKKKILEKLDFHRMKNIKVIIHSSNEYYLRLATCKYLINDTSFMPYFVKREQQIYFNTWHGTPWKHLGRSVLNESHKIGNIQKNLYYSDYILFQNEFTRDVFFDDYMLKNSKNNSKILLNGYPRNTIFFDRKSIDNIKKDMGITNEQVICYMPTWRGLIKDSTNNKALVDTIYYLHKIDQCLRGKQLFYVNLHPYFKGKINFNKFKNIHEFPDKYETYEFLNIADILVTDYSSVFFDFAITGKKIILFMYDKEDYLEDRGVYFSVDDLPFTKVRCISELCNEFNKDKNYDDINFLEKYCNYDNINASKDLLEYIILKKKKKCLKVENIPNNHKKNILIYVGNLAQNGITTALNNLLNNLDLSENNYYLTFRNEQVANNLSFLNNLTREVNYIPMHGSMNLGLIDKFYLRSYKIHKRLFKKNIDLYEKKGKNEIERLYGNIKFDTVIHFTGYDYKRILLMSCFDCKKTIFVHSDMIMEEKTKHNTRLEVLQYAYNHYDNVALVSSDLEESTSKIAGNHKNFRVVNNVIDYMEILKMSKENIIFDKNTKANCDLEKIKNILSNKKNKKFINVGRFSKEKGHQRLIEAFDKFYSNHKNCYLFIIGGYGPLYDELLVYTNTLKSKENIILINSLSNPFPLIKECDFFILSSFYEGFGLAIAEADILGLKVISVDISGPRNFMKENHGTLVENSTQGIYDGMNRLYSGKIKPLNVDYKKYNEIAIKNFKNLL